MKRFKELSSNEKKKAIDYFYNDFSSKEIYQRPAYKKPDYVVKKLQEIQTQIGFCGCKSCLDNYFDIVNKDSQIKEWILSEAMSAAENGYYPDKEDVVVFIR